MKTSSAVLITVALLAGCSKQEATVPVTQPPAATASAKHADAGGIAWFDGNVDAAFAAAKTQNKPVLLYWGAVWCPPCQQLKSTVFLRPDFIEKTKLFVPVYLDGDEPGAQQAGERFRVTGYPTMVVLDAAGNELQRIAGTMDLAQFASLLDTVLGDVQPVNAILDGAAAGRTLNAQECHRLAYNGWGLDDIDKKDYAAHAARLTKAAENCPANATVERMRLKLFALDYAADAEAAALSSGKQPSAALTARIDEIAADLKNSELARNAGDALIYVGNNVFTAVKVRGGKSAPPFVADYSAAMDAIADDARFSEAERLETVASKLAASKTIAPNGKVPEELARSSRSRVDAMLAGEQIPYVRSGIVNSAMHVFEELNDDEAAYRVVKAELPKSKTPYYYKSDLADLAEALGRKDEAIDWYAQAYNEAEGVATRFQWGTLYLLGLVRIKPEDATRIREVGVQVLGELDGPDRIYRRSRTRLERIDRELQAWNKEAKGAHSDVIGALRERMQQTCTKIPTQDPSRETCNSFLTAT